MRYIIWFWKQMKPIRKNILMRIMAGVSQVMLGLLLVWLCRRFIDQAIYSNHVAFECVLLFGVIALLILTRLSVYYLSNMTEVVQQNIIRQRLFRIILNRQMYTTSQAMHSGDVSQRLERDIQTVSAITTSVLPGLVVTTIQLTGAFLLMHAIDTTLAWCLVLVTPIIAVCAKFLSHRLKQMTLDIREKESHIQMLIQESVEQELTVKSLEAAPYIVSRINRMQQELESLTARRVRFTLISRLLLAFTFSYGYFGAFVYGGFQLRDGLITFGVMTAFLQLVGQIQSPVMTLLNMIPQLIHAAASIDRLEDIEHLQQEEKSGTDDIKKAGPFGVRMVNISYTYPEGRHATLSDYSHDFKPGTSTAIMGETGRGKTTMLRLVSGIAQPEKGHIELYDAAGHTICGTAMRHHIIYITQGNTLMSGSIRENLRLAKPKATDEDMRKALHAATADFVFDLQEGLDTKIGEHATRLSEGQAQRIAIARGLLREGSVMLLDEISSALDTATERTLFDRIASYHDKTIICVTHRPEAASRCDECVWL